MTILLKHIEKKMDEYKNDSESTCDDNSKFTTFNKAVEDSAVHSNDKNTFFENESKEYTSTNLAHPKQQKSLLDNDSNDWDGWDKEKKFGNNSHTNRNITEFGDGDFFKGFDKADVPKNKGLSLKPRGLKNLQKELVKEDVIKGSGAYDGWGENDEWDAWK